MQCFCLAVTDYSDIDKDIDIDMYGNIFLIPLSHEKEGHPKKITRKRVTRKKLQILNAC